MISQTAKDGFYKLVYQAIDETLQSDKKTHQWKLKDLRDSDHIRAREFILLTMCAYDFRVFTTVHYTYNRRTLQYVAEALEMPPEQITREKFNDYLGEYGNNYCGTLKRELNQIFTHLGMSTPDRLEERSYKHFDNLKYEHGIFVSATSETKVTLYFGLSVCPYGDLHFQLPKIEAVTTGELEFF